MKSAENPVFRNRINHVEEKYHYIREQIEQGNIEVKYLTTKHRIADVLTKGLS